MTDMTETPILIAGAGGRMGRMLVKVIHETDGLCVAAATEYVGSKLIGEDAGILAGIGEIGIPISDDPAGQIDGVAGIVDFTTTASTVAVSQLAAESGKIHVIGTTGLSSQEEGQIRTAAKKAVIVKSGNMSLGVNLLGQLVKQAAQSLDADFDIEVLEMHHRHKVDAPSGTAFLLGEQAALGRDIDLHDNAVKSRDGHTGARNRGDIGFATLRGGSVVGEHSVIFASEGERITLSHQADDRAIFARGAAKALLWARDKEPGFYSMLDVLGIKG